VNELLEQGGDASLVAKSIELATAAGTPVTLPQVAPGGQE
jgi:hypothetical protein